MAQAQAEAQADTSPVPVLNLNQFGGLVLLNLSRSIVPGFGGALGTLWPRQAEALRVECSSLRGLLGRQGS